MRCKYSLSLMLLMTFSALMRAHPIPSREYDRTVVVHLSASELTVQYHLEVDPFTVFSDVPELVDRDRLTDITSQQKLYEVYQKEIAPILANNLDVTLNDNRLSLSIESTRFEKTDHVRFEIIFKTNIGLEQADSSNLTFRENTFFDQKGQLRLSFTPDVSIKVSTLVEPGEVLRNKKFMDLKPGEENKVRTIQVTFSPTGSEVTESSKKASPPSSIEKPEQSLFDLLLGGRLDLWILGFALFLGAGHALTPGHGKTLVAAYLVGEKGTLGHAILLGIVTALTHTGAVLLVAAVLPYIFPDVKSETTLFLMELIAALLVLGLGIWLLVRRASGKADHVHIGGGHHHHHHDHEHNHGHHHHHHDPSEPVRLRDLIILGITGGIVPCPEAIILLSGAIKMQRLHLAFPLLLAFSLGLALVLVAVGMGVVYSKRWTSQFLKERGWAQRVVRVLPIFSAMLITALGLWMLSVTIHH